MNLKTLRLGLALLVATLILQGLLQATHGVPMAARHHLRSFQSRAPLDDVLPARDVVSVHCDSSSDRKLVALRGRVSVPVERPIRIRTVPALRLSVGPSFSVLSRRFKRRGPPLV